MSTAPTLRVLVPLTDRDLRAVLRAAATGKLTLRQALGRHLARPSRRINEPLHLAACPRHDARHL